MKYIIDENLPPELAIMFRNYDLVAFHINEMKAHSKHRVTDDQIRRVSLRNGSVIVTRDDDFVKSFVSRKVPEKLIYLYGFDRKETLMVRIEEVVSQLEKWIANHDFVEINPKEVRFPFSN